MPFWLILLFFLPFSVQALQIRPPAPNVELFPRAEGPVSSLEYASYLTEGKPYYEKFTFAEDVNGTTITLVLNGETNTVLIGADFNLIRAEYTKAGRTLRVHRIDNSLIYSTNGVDFARYQVPNARVVVFPEIQLRDFFYSKATNISFTQLLTGDFRTAPMAARKRSVTNMGTANGYKDLLPVEVLTYGLPPNEWAMLYYFDDSGWILKKEGYFQKPISRENTTVFMIPKSDSEFYYLGKPSYASELLIKKTGSFAP